MFRDYASVRAVASAVAAAGDDVMDAYREERITDEPHITDRLLASIETNVNALGRRGGPRGTLVWRAKTLRAGSRSAAEEKRFGADLLGVLTIDAPSYRVSKGFLAQAKRAEPSVPMSVADWERFQQQCATMLKTTPDSFGMIFSRRKGVRLVSASAVVSSSDRDVFSLYDMGLRGFFERHIESFVGDPRLSKAHISALESARREAQPDRSIGTQALHLIASGER